MEADMAESRRNFLKLGLGTAAGMVAARAAAQHDMPGMHHDIPMSPPPTGRKPAAPAARPSPRPAGAPVPVETPDLTKLSWTMDGGVKVFELVAAPVTTRFVPWKQANVWGYNGSCPGPTVEATEGDRVRFVVRNLLPEPTVMHWHGLEVPIEMDGVEGISQDFIQPGETFVYEFTLHQHGTFFYHSHRPMQQMMGMIGLFVVHPRRPYEPRVDRDIAWILQEWATLPGNATPNSLAMEFNWMTMNGKAGPDTTPALARLGERVRLRFVNLGMDHHPIHLHGHTWVTTGTEGGRIPRAAWIPGNTELVGVAQARTMEFVANNPGDWMIHCHLPHHMMNAMASMVGPLSEPRGVPAGLGMEEGMGMPHGGHALSSEHGPSFGRTTGVDADQRASHAPMGATGEHGAHGAHAGHDTASAAPNARQVPGYPQDMFMVMDEAVVKPETHGLRPGWTGAMMGMMTLLRVLPPDRYDEIQELKRRQADEEKKAMEPFATAHHGTGGDR
jgi:FtsP/CotA-like multicopper oxidase with cupredoxin domain